MKLIRCWSCDKEMSLQEHKGRDGFCAHCGAEIEMDLEYRRANNIFEVYDSVIRLDGSTPSVYRVHEIYECGAIGIVRHPTPTRPHWTCLPSDRLRHATDEEIKAGHRL